MLEALTTLLQHGFGHLRQSPDGTQHLTLTFTPQKGESLPDLEARIAAQRMAQDTVEVVVRDGRIARIDLIRNC